jgi:hypothetical protein
VPARAGTSGSARYLRFGCTLAILLASLSVGALSADGVACPEGNLLELEGVELSGGGPGASRAADGRFAAEGGPGGLLAVPLDLPLRVDLGAPRTIGAMLLQAEGDDSYLIAGSMDGVAWEELALAGATGGGGMRSRALRIPSQPHVRFLRISADGGDGSFSVSEFAAWCELPTPPSASDAPFASRQAARRTVRAVQFSTALLGMCLCGWGLSLRYKGRERYAVRTRSTMLALLGILAGLSWWNLGGLHFGRYLHLTDNYHYFLGAKYYTELGHERLYECTAIADVEDGLGEAVRQRRIRDMRSNRLVSTEAVLADPDGCKSRFASARWDAFKRDVAWFRAAMPPPRWERTFVDHGYNAPPAWGILGSTLSKSVVATDTTMLLLALIDPFLLLVMWGFVLWAFGWRTACVAALFWGTNQLEGFSWTGGAFLRQDWLVLSIVGICLVRRRVLACGGFALTYATLLRVFPGFIVAALVLQAAAKALRGFRSGNGLAAIRDYRRFAAGCLVALAVIVPLSLLTSGGPSAWGAFAENSRANLRSTGSNMVGLMVLLSYEPQNRWEVLADPSLENPEERWLEAKRDVFKRMRPLFWVLVLGFALLLWRAVKDERDWAALALGIGLIPIASFLACYYYSILLGYGLLYERRREIIGVLLCALSVLTHVAYWVFPSGMEYDQRYALNSLGVVAVVVLVTALRSPPALSGEPRSSR